MKCFYWILWWGFTLLAATSCSNDEDEVLPPEAEEVHFTQTDYDVLVNTKDIVIGEKGGEEYWVDMVSTILSTGGKVEERTINCAAMASITRNENGEMDTTDPVEHVTLINKGHIEVHTKELYELYKDQIQTPDHPERPYKYLRVLVMFGGKYSTVINEGVIDVYFDHDPDAQATIYVMALSGGEGSQLLNKGEINFHGYGSVATRFRGMATFGDCISAVNSGTMTADVTVSEDARFITTGGNDSNVINDGIMKMRAPGTVYMMTRYGNNNMVNNNTMELYSVDYPEGVTPVGNGTVPTSCAMYEPLQEGRKTMPPMVNRGTIKITMEGTEKANTKRKSFGMYLDLMDMGGEKHIVTLVNEGNITVKQAAPVRLTAGEAAFVARKAAEGAACNVNVARWTTGLRDFSQTKDLFLLMGAHVNFGGGELVLQPGEGYAEGTAYSIAPEALMFNQMGNNPDVRFECSGYDALKVRAFDAKHVLDWNKEEKTAALRTAE